MRDEVGRSLEVYLLGQVEYEDALSLQGRLVYELGEGELGGALVICEHPPIISVGRQGSRHHVAADDEELRSRGLRMRWVNRGGGCVLHLPGQVSAYLVLSLRTMNLSLQQYLDGLNGATRGLLEEFDIRVRTHAGHSGLFAGQARIAHVGVAVKRWIAYHGITVNVGSYLEPFRLLDEPGPGGTSLRQSSLEAQRQRPAPMSRVREALIRQIESAFGLRQHHIYTHHPLIGTKARRNVHAQSFH